MDQGITQGKLGKKSNMSKHHCSKRKRKTTQPGWKQNKKASVPKKRNLYEDKTMVSS